MHAKAQLSLEKAIAVTPELYRRRKYPKHCDLVGKFANGTLATSSTLEYMCAKFPDLHHLTVQVSLPT